jgi:hypothetical protein
MDFKVQSAYLFSLSSSFSLAPFVSNRKSLKSIFNFLEPKKQRAEETSLAQWKAKCEEEKAGRQ